MKQEFRSLVLSSKCYELSDTDIVVKYISRPLLDIIYKTQSLKYV